MTWRLAAAFLGASIRRLIAAGIAIAIGTAFLASAILAMTAITETVRNTITRPYGNASVLIYGITDIDQLATVEATPGVTAVEFTPASVVTLGDNSGTNGPWFAVNGIPSSPEMRIAEPSEGTWPQPGQVMVPESVLVTSGLSLGDQITVSYHSYVPTIGDSTVTSAGFTLVGTLTDAAAVDQQGQLSIILAPSDALTIAERSREAITETLIEGVPLESVPLGGAMIATEPGQAEAVSEALSPLFIDMGGVAISTSLVDSQLSYVTGDQQYLKIVTYAFAAIALVVSGLVIANTYQVLVAHRRQLIGLLRCVGATKRQVFGFVLGEAALVGISAAIIGVVVGVGLVALALWVLQRIYPLVPFSSIIPMPVHAIWIPMLAGIVVTIAAALVPARTATMFAPLDTLRPPSRGSDRLNTMVRIAIAIVAGVSAVVLAGFALAQDIPRAYAMAFGLGAATATAVSFMAISPLMVRAVAKGLSRWQRPATLHLAATNINRHSRRAGAAANALFIGVVLVAVMLIGSEAARKLATDGTQVMYPVDVFLAPMPEEATFIIPDDLDPAGTDDTADSDSGIPPIATPAPIDGIEPVPEPLPSEPVEPSESSATTPAAPLVEDTVTDLADGTELGPFGYLPEAHPLQVSTQQIDAVAATPGVGAAIVVKQATVSIQPEWLLRQPAYSEFDHHLLYGLPDGVADEVGNIAWNVPPLGTSDIALDTNVADMMGLAPGDQITVHGDAGAAQLTVVPGNATGYSMYAHASVVAAISAKADDQIWVHLVDLNSARATLVSLSDVAAKNDMFFWAPVEQRLYYAQAIDSSLLVVLALVAIALVIAVVGISNTLALSVLERTSESATLRALGLTRGQLQRVLTWEGVVIAAVGTIGGIVVGLGLGWLGSKLLLDNLFGIADTPLVLSPWLIAVAGLAVVAGLLASLLPARAATRNSVVAGLATD